MRGRSKKEKIIIWILYRRRIYLGFMIFLVWFFKRKMSRLSREPLNWFLRFIHLILMRYNKKGKKDWSSSWRKQSTNSSKPLKNIKIILGINPKWWGIWFLSTNLHWLHRHLDIAPTIKRIIRLSPPPLVLLRYITSSLLEAMCKNISKRKCLPIWLYLKFSQKSVESLNADRNKSAWNISTKKFR